MMAGSPPVASRKNPVPVCFLIRSVISRSGEERSRPKIQSNRILRSPVPQEQNFEN